MSRLNFRCGARIKFVLFCLEDSDRFERNLMLKTNDRISALLKHLKKMMTFKYTGVAEGV